VQVVEAEQRAGQLHEPEQDVGVPLVADLQAPVAASQASDRSTTYRWRPSRWLDSMPRRAIRGVMPRRLSARRQRG
jgi:hypothetical protein